MGVYKDSNGTWYINIKVKIDGKYKNIKKRGFKTKKEGLLMEDDLKRISLSKINRLALFSEVANEFIKLKKIKYSEGTLRKYTGIIKKYFKCILDRKISDIKKDELDKIYLSVIQLNYNTERINTIIRALNYVFEYATKKGYISSFTFEEYEYIKRKEIKKEMSIWTYDEFVKFMNEIPEENKYKLFFETLFFTGMRSGEIRGLKKVI